MALLSTSRKTRWVQTERAVRATVVNFLFQNVLFICTHWFISFSFLDLWTKKTRRSVSGKQHHNIYNSSPLRAHTYFPPMFYLSTRGTTTWAVFHLELSGRHQSHLACAIGETKPVVRSICGLDCEQSLFFFRFSKGSARALERWAAKPREARNKGGSPRSLAPSVTRVVICVSRGFCWTDQEKRETTRSLSAGHRQNHRSFWPPAVYQADLSTRHDFFIRQHWC